MGVATTADAVLDEVEENLDVALKGLSRVVVKHSNGWDDFSSSYQEHLISFFSELLKIRNSIRW